MPDAIPAQAGHTYSLRVQWEDTDAAGIVYYANYLRFVERARSDILLAQGIRQEAILRQQGLAFAVRACSIDYLRPARLHDDLTVTTTLHEARGASLILDQKVWRAAELLAPAQVTLACIDLNGRPKRIPHAISTLFATLSTNFSQSSGSQTTKE